MPSDAHDSRRKHRRSSSPDDHDKSSKRHKHRHHHHRHRHGTKKRDEEIQFDDETVAAVPSQSPPPNPAPRNHLHEDDVEEGEILDDEAFEVGKKQIESDVEAGEIEVKEDRDLRSDKKIPGLPTKSSKTESEDFNNDKVVSPTSDAEDGKWRQSHVDSRIHEDGDSPNHSRAETLSGTDALGNGYLDVKSSKRDKRHNGLVEHFKGTEKHKGDFDDEALEANRRDVNSHRNSSESGEEKQRVSGNSPLQDGYRSRSRSIGHTRDRSRSRSVVEEYAHRKSRHSREQGSLYETSRHKTDYDLDEERAREYRREHRRGSKDLLEDDRREHSTRYHSREARDRARDKDRSRDKDVDRDLHREKKREETSRDKEVDWVRRREKERGRNHERHRNDVEKDRSRESDEGRDRRREKERDRSRDTVYERDRRRELERAISRDRPRGGDRERDWKSERDYRNRERDNIKERDRRDDRYRHNDKDALNGEDKYMRREDGNDSGDRYKKHSRHEENGYHADRKRDYTMEEDERKLKGNEVEQDDVDEDTLELPEQEEEDLNRIKEESRRRREAIMEKYKKQNQQIQQAAGNEEKDKGVEIHADISKASDGKSDDVDDVEPSFSVGKSPPENVDVGSEKVPGAGGLGEGTPKSEGSADKYCDDIFGETPTGVRKSGKGDGLLIERVGLHDNWDDAEGYYSYRFGEILDGRYEVTAAHGKGVFSTVVRAKNLKAGNGEPDEVAIKIIRNNDTMYKAGLDELVVLKKLVGADPDDKRHCVRFLSSFKYRNHLCLVFESLNMNLREVLKKFGRNIGLRLTAVRAYAKQLFIALKHLRNCGVLHCDIKPDNMLVNEAKNVLKLCDFGNAMFAGKNEVTPYLVSRFYRAPEIILGLQYDHPLDIWSVGCCLYELYTGKVLFPGLTNNDMLRLHMELKGPFPKKMLRKGAFTEQHYDQDLCFYATEEDPVTKKAIKRMILNIKAKDIGTIITGSPGEDPKMVANFKDLLDKIFVLDPEKRLTVSQALNHPFITGK
ncbi:non-specific serine/threonine protein kinase [Trifolium repens]|nr:non-specific serine/threonine protein kinase [Trifolium repens]